MLLKRLTLRNFKGIKDFTLEPEGEHIKVFGDNATGKTTIFDAVTWLLFDKDSNNKKDFSIKTLTGQGQEISGLDHEVEAHFEVDGSPLSLSKTYKEKWTKKRGDINKQLTGHTTEYHIDGVPAKKKEYDEKVSSIIDEDIFKLLTSPSYFNEQLHWQKRRDILLEIAGDVSDEEVMKSRKGLDKLADALNGRSIEDHRKVIASKRKEINKQIDEIPLRMDEVDRGKPDTSRLDEEQIKSSIEQLSQDLDAKQEELNRIQSGGEVTEKQKKLAEVQGELQEIKNHHQSDQYEKINEKRSSLNGLEKEKSQLEQAITQLNNRISTDDGQIQQLNQDASDLRQQWQDTNAKEYDGIKPTKDDQDCTCSACGQNLPADQVEAAHEKAVQAYEANLAEFNRRKSQQLEDIKTAGVQKKEKVQELEQDKASAQQEAEQAQKQLEAKQNEITALSTEIENLQANVSDISENAQYQAKQQEAENIEQEIKQLKDSVQESMQRVRTEMDELKSKKAAFEQDQAKFQQKRQAADRIKELEDEQKELSAQYEKLEHELYLTEEFIRAKVDLLEEKINNKFKHARFKLFDTQINEGLKETCETLFQGVPYSGGLNNAARINVGLDIINTLSEHYRFSAPIFVDNSEAVTRLIDTKAQVISLVVSEPDKQLRIEQAHHKEAV
ncbi:AAA family ATPase [Salibacterium halotolerans]|nr:AAA family ATPase [Salibacterium halotolerans]